MSKQLRPSPWCCVLVSSILISLPAAAAPAWDAVESVPGQSPVTVQVQDQARLYFRLTSQAPLMVPVDGPVRLRITSRVELPKGSTQVVSYSVRVSEGGREIERQDTESSSSTQAQGPDGRHEIGKSRKMTLDVPAGHHLLAIAVSGTPSLLVRLHRAAPASGGEATVTLTPFESSRTVTVNEGQKTISYHSVLPGKPVRLRVVGPTSLDLITRLDFDATMRGTQRYRLLVSERGQRIREVEFGTTKSTTAVFTDLTDRVPSKFDRVRLPIASGTHEISIELTAPSRGAAEIHARIPQPSTGTQE